jgi:hypothetical protein
MLLLGAEINSEIEAAAAETRISASSAAVRTDYATVLDHLMRSTSRRPPFY